MDEKDIAAVIFDNISLPNKSLTEQLEVKNHQTALNFLFVHINKKEKIDEALTLKLHSIFMNRIRLDAGVYRNHVFRITGVNLPTANYMSVPKLISEVITHIVNRLKDIVALSANVHSKFEQIYPFSDGSGRIGRLLINAMLLQANLPPAIIHQKQKQLYYTYLHKAQTKDACS